LNGFFDTKSVASLAAIDWPRGWWLFPNDGHLTGEGNRVVADILAAHFDQWAN
jgi:hypothetical protein